ncbi:DnaJ domain-containing protein [Lasiosphaeris hirsuta]|uniref:DnaJ domain-containing protein n=1 Tax=Lasiosphaeris hirsuta TaxID=260670 RepID=A0AA40A1T8_9PEZI|nr:DnaJ domain-containing protein [Lasiosphaeris hirsuta]
MASYDDLGDTEPPTIDPYEVLEIDRTATPDQVKSAYRKAALKNHPDKVSDDKKDEAKEKFQSIAFAYAILSDQARRKRYDETGSTSEAIVDSEGFSWSEFYRAQFQDAISEDAINQFAAKYKGSDEEKDDILAAYEEFKGDMDGIYETVMLSNVLEDDERIRKVIDDAIASGEVESFVKYRKETKKSKQARIKAAKSESQEADELAKELGVYDKLRGKGSKKDPEASLAALIQRNQASRASAFDQLAEKYGAAPKSSKSGKKRTAKEYEEPDISDEQFEALRANMMKKAKKRRGA